jgi:hypothetical protein
MALIDGKSEFANALVLAFERAPETNTQAAMSMAQSIAELFSYATLDGADINPGSNTAEAAMEALASGLMEAYILEDDGEGCAELIEEAILSYLNEAPIVNMWGNAVEATKDGPNLYDVMEEDLEGYEDEYLQSKVQVSTGIIRWVNEAVKVELDEVPARYEYVV